MRKKYILLFFMLIPRLLFALQCEDFATFKEHGGHWYVITSNKMTFPQAKQIAENNGGYLAIPNNASENMFLAKTFGTAWIGIHDPNFTQSLCIRGTQCSPTAHRFRTVKGEVPSFSNWSPGEPSNSVYEYDIINNRALVAPLGEHWAAIGPNGEWGDFGNHAEENNNPIRFKAIFEFDSKPSCLEGDTSPELLEERKCTEAIYNTGTIAQGTFIPDDGDSAAITQGNTYVCQRDQFKNEYCPAQVAPCGEEWDYKNGISQYAEETYFVVEPSKYSEAAQCVPSETVRCNSKLLVKDIVFSIHYYSTRRARDDRVRVIQTNIGNTFGWTGGLEDYFETLDYRLLEYMGIDIRTIHDSSQLRSWLQHAWSNHTAYHGPTQITIKASIQAFQKYSCDEGTIEEKDGQIVCRIKRSNAYYKYLCQNELNSQGFDYEPIVGRGDNSVPPENNCKRLKYMCQAAKDRPCAFVDNQWQCSPFPCFGDSDIEDADTTMGRNDTNNKGFNDDGSCSGQIRLFNGKDMRCRSKDKLFGAMGGGCCKRGKPGGIGNLFTKCNETETLLSKYRKESSDKSHEVGEYCSKRIKLGFAKICIQNKKTFCVFNSKLGRIIQEQGRPQLGIGWGEPKSPNCSGFTPEQFQKIDFSKLDLSEFYGDIEKKVQAKINARFDQTIQQKLNSFSSNLNGGKP